MCAASISISTLDKLSGTSKVNRLLHPYNLVTSVSPAVTVSLALITGLAGGAAASLTKVTARASLTWK